MRPRNIEADNAKNKRSDRGAKGKSFGDQDRHVSSLPEMLRVYSLVTRQGPQGFLSAPRREAQLPPQRVAALVTRLQRLQDKASNVLVSSITVFRRRNIALVMFRVHFERVIPLPFHSTPLLI